MGNCGLFTNVALRCVTLSAAVTAACEKVVRFRAHDGLCLFEEGALQFFRPEMGGNMLLGAVGQLQFEVVQHRLKGEYDADIRLEGSQYTGARWISADTPAELREFVNAYPQRMAKDAADTLAFLCTSPYDVRLAQERFPKIHFHPLREHAGLSLGSAG